MKAAISSDIIIRALNTDSGHTEVVWRRGEDNDQKRLSFVSKVSQFGSVNELLLSTFDKLSSDTKEMAKHCAVIGPSFSVEDLLIMGWEEEDNVEQLLAELELMDIVFEDDDEEWRFRHQFWQSAIYNMMLPTVRVELHTIYAEQLSTSSDSSDIKTLSKLLNHFIRAENVVSANENCLLVGEWYSKRGLLDAEWESYDCVSDCWMLKRERNLTDVAGRVSVLTAKAKNLATQGRKIDSAEMYKSALKFFEEHEEEVPDKSIVFPVISGILLALKWKAIDVSEQRERSQRRLLHKKLTIFSG